MEKKHEFPLATHFLSPAWMGALIEPCNKVSLHLLTDLPGTRFPLSDLLPAEQDQGSCLLEVGRSG